MGLTSSALSNSIRRLEAELGSRLFERAAQGMRLTTFGAAFAERARRLRADHDDLLRHAHDVRAGSAGVLRIGASMDTLDALVAPVLARLLPLHPTMQARIVQAPADALVERLGEGQIDVALVSDHAGAPTGLMQKTVGRDFFVPVVRDRHPLAQCSPMQMADLAGYAWILPADRATVVDPLRSVFAEAGQAFPRVAVEVDGDTGAALPIVLHTDLIAYVPRGIIKPPFRECVRVLPLEQLHTVHPLSALLRDGACNPPLLDEFLGILADMRVEP